MNSFAAWLVYVFVVTLVPVHVLSERQRHRAEKLTGLKCGWTGGRPVVSPETAVVPFPYEPELICRTGAEWQRLKAEARGPHSWEGKKKP